MFFLLGYKVYIWLIYLDWIISRNLKENINAIFWQLYGLGLQWLFVYSISNTTKPLYQQQGILYTNN